MATFARIMVAAVALTVGVSAQQKPNFSGRWVIVSPAKGAGQEQLVKHDDTTLSAEMGGPDHRVTYQLDGVERRIAVPGKGTEITMMAKALWDGDRVVITSSIAYSNGMKTQSREIWSLDAQGRLIVDYTESGPTGAGPSTKVIYTRKQG